MYTKCNTGFRYSLLSEIYIIYSDEEFKQGKPHAVNETYLVLLLLLSSLVKAANLFLDTGILLRTDTLPEWTMLL